MLVLLECLAKGHFNLWTGGTWDQTTDPLMKIPVPLYFLSYSHPKYVCFTFSVIVVKMVGN